MHPLQKINFITHNNAYVVEASAGTGKTWTIERLFIKALLECSNGNNNLSISIENILVLTFTNDATSELKQRIQEQIHITTNQIMLLHNCITHVDTEDIFIKYLFSRKDDYVRDITLLNRAYQNFDRASIYTIHGFCNKIIRDYPFDCQVNSSFDVVVNKASLIEDIVRDFIRYEIINRFKSKIENVFNNLELIFPNSNYDLTLEQKIVANLPNDLLKIENGSYVSKYALVANPTLSNIDSIDISNKLEFKAEFLSYLIDYIVMHYPKYIAKTSALSYDELVQKVADTVSNSDILANKIFATFPVAFIDEFQDTDIMQWQIFKSIYQFDKAVRGNVVVVGDPKQAIYRFRNADVDTYLLARNQINNKLYLDTNFRSHPKIVNFINQLFSLTNQGSNVEQSILGRGIDYLPVNSSSCDKAVLPSALSVAEAVRWTDSIHKFHDEEVQLVVVNGKKKSDRVHKLLQSMTFEILALLKVQPTLKGKIAILVTTNREGSEIVTYLRKYGIKAQELKLGNVFATRTAIDLYSFLHAIFDLTNRKNFIKAVTSKLFNLPLTLLSMENKDNLVIQKLHEDFFIYQQIWIAEGLTSLIYVLLNNLFVSDNSGQCLNNRELSNIWQLVELLGRQKITNQAELLLWFKQKITNAKNNQVGDINGNNEELVRLDSDDEQIIITTQHKAKGLEYEILFCPYFKSNAILDITKEYKRPFFSNYNYKSGSSMVVDKEIGECIINSDNKEINRLNYVALTRAKSRIYIYLKQHTRSGNKYNMAERPDKLVELFGYVRNNPEDQSHLLFNYSKFFGNTPNSAIKDHSLLPGVVAYNRDCLTDEILDTLRLNKNTKKIVDNKLHYVHDKFKCTPSFHRQSYTTLARNDSYDFYIDNDDTNTTFIKTNYKYSILLDDHFKGATFGLLFHELCEKYPFSQECLVSILNKHNVNHTHNDYAQQLTMMLDEAFNYHILDNSGIKDFAKKIHELDFNLEVRSDVSITFEIKQLINNYFGMEHPFSLSCATLGQIKTGFLVGFIDLLFEHDGKYWVLDYKTNTLDGYASSVGIYDINNPLIISMSEHHYYLQYLLYLVAVKRYLQQRLKIDDATELIGGAVYYYVRGIYCLPQTNNEGLYVDRGCANLVRDLDNLFK